LCVVPALCFSSVMYLHAVAPLSTETKVSDPRPDEVRFCCGTRLALIFPSLRTQMSFQFIKIVLGHHKLANRLFQKQSVAKCWHERTLNHASGLLSRLVLLRMLPIGPSASCASRRMESANSDVRVLSRRAPSLAQSPTCRILSFPPPTS